jgi:hypothetical protein
MIHRCSTSDQPPVPVGLLRVVVNFSMAVRAQASQVLEVVGAALGAAQLVMDDPDGLLPAALAEAPAAPEHERTGLEELLTEGGVLGGLAPHKEFTTPAAWDMSAAA